MIRAIVVIAVISACGRLRFDSVHDAAIAGDTGIDSVDADTGPALCNMPFGTWMLTPPVAMDDINTMLIATNPANGDQDEYDPVFSEDGLSLYFTSDQSGMFYVWVATRPSLTAPFDTVAMLGPDVNGAANSIFGFQPLDTLGRAIISAPYAGTIGGDDYWLGTRAGTWSWTPTSLSTVDGDGDARMTADGLTVYFARGPNAMRDIYRATRADVISDFGPATLVPELNSAESDSSPLPTTEGIFVVTDRPGGMGSDDIWYADHGAASAFDTLYPLTALNTAAFDGEPALFERNGACELIFSSGRVGVTNLYRSVAMPK